MWEGVCPMKAITMLHENKGGIMGDIRRALYFQVMIIVTGLG